jgi:hypothetical protein
MQRMKEYKEAADVLAAGLRAGEIPLGSRGKALGGIMTPLAPEHLLLLQ